MEGDDDDTHERGKFGPVLSDGQRWGGTALVK
jgi:hypothetical protein